MKTSSVDISLHEISVACHLGWSDEERAFPQLVVVDLKCSVRTSGVEQSDELEDTLDYCQILKFLEVECAGRTWRLLEKMGADLADGILNSFSKVERLELSIRKNIFANTKGVTVTRIAERS